jgi:hypothetical protein
MAHDHRGPGNDTAFDTGQQHADPHGSCGLGSVEQEDRNGRADTDPPAGVPVAGVAVTDSAQVVDAVAAGDQVREGKAAEQVPDDRGDDELPVHSGCRASSSTIAPATTSRSIAP